MLHAIAQNTQPVDSTAYIAIGVGLVALMYFYMRGKARKRDPLEKPAQRLSLAQQRSLERDMNNLVVELSEMARQITAQLDTRATKLELLIREADEKIARLQQLQSHQPPDTPAAPSSAEPAEPAPPPPPPEPEPDPIAPRHAEVYALADQGYSAQSIAQQLNRPSGEVELILALRSTTRVQ